MWTSAAANGAVTPNISWTCREGIFTAESNAWHRCDSELIMVTESDFSLRRLCAPPTIPEVALIVIIITIDDSTRLPHMGPPQLHTTTLGV